MHKIIDHRKRYSPVGRCIYCGAEGNVTDEHILALGLGGKAILPKASCEVCREVTCKIETACLKQMFNAVRAHLNISSGRHKKKNLEPVPLEIIDADGRIQKPPLSIKEHPFSLCMVKFEEAVRPLGIPPSETHRPIFWLFRSGDALEEIKKHGGMGVKMGAFNPLIFARMLAKIAHAFAVAELGIYGFKPLLPDLILGKSTAINDLVGGNLEDVPSIADTHLLRESHWVKGLDGKEYVVVEIRLFANLGAPEYYVIAGERLPN